LTGEITKQLLEHKKKPSSPSPPKTPLPDTPITPIKEQAKPITEFAEKVVPLIPPPPPVELKPDPAIISHESVGGMGIIGGKTCTKCGGGPIVKREGCEVCMSCGDVKCGGS